MFGKLNQHMAGNRDQERNHHDERQSGQDDQHSSESTTHHFSSPTLSCHAARSGGISDCPAGAGRSKLYAASARATLGHSE